MIEVNDAARDVNKGITVPPAVLAETTVPAEFIIWAPPDEDGVMMALWLRFVIVWNEKIVIFQLTWKYREQPTCCPCNDPLFDDVVPWGTILFSCVIVSEGC